MPASLASYITQYGYVAIFSLIFLQELGVPNPVPNELVLIFSGYLASAGILDFSLVLLAAIAGDFLGTTILFLIFYHGGEYILNHRPRWLPLSRERVERMSSRISRQERLGIYLGRLVPYLRGYTSVAAGLMQVRPTVFLTAVAVSAVTWSGGYVVAGKLMGPYWKRVADQVGNVENVLVILIAIICITLLVRYFRRQRARRRPESPTLTP